MEPIKVWVPPRSDHYLASNVWTTICGWPGWRNSADGINRSAYFANPTDIAMDAETNLFVADQVNHTIRKISPDETNWIVTTIAGYPGAPGSADGMNSFARFNQPGGIAISRSHKLYVADSLNHAIREITLVGTNWVVRTIAGQIGRAGYADGTNRFSRFFRPTGITVSKADEIFITEAGNNLIRKLVLKGTNWVVTTVAGTPGKAGAANGLGRIATFNSPQGIVVDSKGNLFVADQFNCVIRRLSENGNGWLASTIAGKAGMGGSADGTNSNARFFSPCGLAIDALDRLYVTDSGNHTIRRITPAGTNWWVNTVGGTSGRAGWLDGVEREALFNLPQGIAVDSSGGAYFVADSMNHVVRMGKAVSTYEDNKAGYWRIIGTSASGSGTNTSGNASPRLPIISPGLRRK